MKLKCLTNNILKEKNGISLHHCKLPSNEFWNKRKGNLLDGENLQFLTPSKPTFTYKLYIWVCVCKHRQYLGLAKAKKNGPPHFWWSLPFVWQQQFSITFANIH
jgi:hypothetical protein